MLVVFYHYSYLYHNFCIKMIGIIIITAIVRVRKAEIFVQNNHPAWKIYWKVTFYKGLKSTSILCFFVGYIVSI